MATRHSKVVIYREKLLPINSHIPSQLTFTCSKSTKKITGKRCEISYEIWCGVVLVFLLSLNIFHTFYGVFYGIRFEQINVNRV